MWFIQAEHLLLSAAASLAWAGQAWLGRSKGCLSYLGSLALLSGYTTLFGLPEILSRSHEVPFWIVYLEVLFGALEVLSGSLKNKYLSGLFEFCLVYLNSCMGLPEAFSRQFQVFLIAWILVWFGWKKVLPGLFWSVDWFPVSYPVYIKSCFVCLKSCLVYGNFSHYLVLSSLPEDWLDCLRINWIWIAWNLIWLPNKNDGWPGLVRFLRCLAGLTSMSCCLGASGYLIGPFMIIVAAALHLGCAMVVIDLCLHRSPNCSDPCVSAPRLLKNSAASGCLLLFEDVLPVLRQRSSG